MQPGLSAANFPSSLPPSDSADWHVLAHRPSRSRAGWSATESAAHTDPTGRDRSSRSWSESAPSSGAGDARGGWHGHLGPKAEVLKDPGGGHLCFEHGDQPEPAVAAGTPEDAPSLTRWCSRPRRHTDSAEQRAAPIHLPGVQASGTSLSNIVDVPSHVLIVVARSRRAR
jgi:hypothetical protein